ncbi:HAUS augmin-like complex subunit 6 [Pogoniulus pusillus]|uniref:HAUS augmin-like complex subunit 6 n=1 Tax=Pogoniulus pusillus TaxID=488313 RepID=UPI0030B982AB
MKTFDKSNQSAFAALLLFLCAKLDYSRAKPLIACYVPGFGVTNSQFRKKCCDWLKAISVQERRLPYITPSLFLCPGGLRVTQLLYWLARYIMVKDLKENSVGIDTSFAEDGDSRSSDVHMARARCRVACSKLLQVFQQEDFVWQEYEKKSQLLTEEIEQMKSEYEALQKQSWNMKQNDENKSYEAERIQKVRSMWTFIMEMLTSLKNEREVVASVLDELEDPLSQCVLDGNVVFRIPKVLTHRAERNAHQYGNRSLYEDKNLNFLIVMKLLNEALRALRDENCQPELNELHAIERMVACFKKEQETLNTMRLKIEQQLCVSGSASVARNQEDWEMKWKSFLGVHPSDLISDQDLQLGLLRSSPPCSFDVAEERDENNVFCHHLASALDIYDSLHEEHFEKDDGTLETVMDKSTPSPSLSSAPLELPEASENREYLHVGTCRRDKKPVSPEPVKNEKDESSTSPASSSVSDHVIQTECPVNNKSHLEKARDDLAEEIARTVMCESPQCDEEKAMPLDDLVNVLVSDPFLTRTKIPRTPENLLTETRSSWRKAIQTEVSSDMPLAPAEVIKEAALVDATPIMMKAADSKFTFPIPAYPVPDFDPPLLEKTSHLSSTEFRLEEQMKTNNTIQSPVLETSGKQKTALELTDVVLEESTVKQTLEYVKKSMDPPAVLSENNSRTNVTLSDPLQGSIMDGALYWHESFLLSSLGHEADCLGILGETLPEGLDSIDFSETASLQCDVDEIDSACATSGSEDERDIKNSTLNLQSLLNMQSRLLEAAAASEEEVHQTNNEGESVSHGLYGNLAPERKEDEFSSSQEVFCLDEEFTKTPSPRSLEKKNSLSSLLVACEHLAEMASEVHSLPLDLTERLKDTKQLDEQLGTKDPSSEQNL